MLRYDVSVNEFDFLPLFFASFFPPPEIRRTEREKFSSNAEKFRPFSEAVSRRQRYIAVFLRYNFGRGAKIRVRIRPYISIFLRITFNTLTDIIICVISVLFVLTFVCSCQPQPRL